MNIVVILLFLGLVFVTTAFCLLLFSILHFSSKIARISLTLIWIVMLAYFAHTVWFKVFPLISKLLDYSY
jgi:hypothetical protein